MLKIGDFSRFAQVSVRLLRHYDQMDLLKPAHVDGQSGYRYYSAQQLPQLNHILAMRDLGLSLDQIARVMQEKRSPGQLLEMLRWKQDELETIVADEQARLARLRALIARLEQDGSHHVDVIIKRIDASYAASCYRVIPIVEDTGIALRRLITDTTAIVARSGARPAGPAILIFLDLEFKETDIQVQAAVTLQKPAKLGGDVQCIAMPAIPAVASCAVRGQGSIRSGYEALLQWIEANDYRVAGPARELYLVSPNEPSTLPPPEDGTLQIPTADQSFSGKPYVGTVTEIQIPVERRVESQESVGALASPTTHDAEYRHLGHWYHGDQSAPDLADVLLRPQTLRRNIT